MSGSVLKLIACLAMLIDHMAAFLPGDFMDMKETLFTIGDKAFTLRMIMHYIGRIAFPIFAYLITEGFIHTRDRKRYGINLFIFALISEIPWNLAHTGTFFYGRQNVFFTLLLGYLGLCALEHYKSDYKKAIITLAGLLGISLLLRADYTCFGLGFIILLYMIKDRRLMAIIGCCVLPSRWIGGLAFIPILMYNGQRGFAKAKWTKYAFYIFYPLHLLVLYLVRTYILL
jgi:hypothetical protein